MIKTFVKIVMVCVLLCMLYIVAMAAYLTVDSIMYAEYARSVLAFIFFMMASVALHIMANESFKSKVFTDE